MFKLTRIKVLAAQLIVNIKKGVCEVRSSSDLTQQEAQRNYLDCFAQNLHLSCQLDAVLGGIVPLLLCICQLCHQALLLTAACAQALLHCCIVHSQSRHLRAGI